MHKIGRGLWIHSSLFPHLNPIGVFLEQRGEEEYSRSLLPPPATCFWNVPFTRKWIRFLLSIPFEFLLRYLSPVAFTQINNSLLLLVSKVFPPSIDLFGSRDTVRQFIKSIREQPWHWIRRRGCGVARKCQPARLNKQIWSRPHLSPCRRKRGNLSNIHFRVRLWGRDYPNVHWNRGSHHHLSLKLN